MDVHGRRRLLRPPLGSQDEKPVMPENIPGISLVSSLITKLFDHIMFVVRKQCYLR